MHHDDDGRRRHDNRQGRARAAFKALGERIRDYPMQEVARAGILAEVEATYRRERAAMHRSSTSSL
jgi:hypothetical protein